jgi:hypothetical protein
VVGTLITKVRLKVTRNVEDTTTAKEKRIGARVAWMKAGKKEVV